jgi:hypothetical protein
MPCVIFSDALEIFQSIDVFGVGNVERDHADQIRICVNQLLCSLVAAQSHKAVEQRPGKQHRVTHSPSIRSERDLTVAPPPPVGHAISR